MPASVRLLRMPAPQHTATQPGKAPESRAQRLRRAWADVVNAGTFVAAGVSIIFGWRFRGPVRPRDP